MRFQIRTTATAIIEEHWLVDAENEEAARALILGEPEGEATIVAVEDNTLGDEQNRQIEAVMRVPDDAAL